MIRGPRTYAHFGIDSKRFSFSRIGIVEGEVIEKFFNPDGILRHIESGIDIIAHNGIGSPVGIYTEGGNWIFGC